jgi:OmpA family protein
MAREVATTGHIALYGILFDTNKTDIKLESVGAIDEIAKFLKTDPKVIVYIVRHTDNVGGYDRNMALSHRRAEAVVKDLTTRHGIAPARLKLPGSVHWHRWHRMRPKRATPRIAESSWSSNEIGPRALGSWMPARSKA